MKMLCKPITRGYVKVTFYMDEEWEQELSFRKMIGKTDDPTVEILSVKNQREGFIQKFKNYTQLYNSDSQPNTFIVEE